MKKAFYNITNQGQEVISFVQESMNNSKNYKSATMKVTMAWIAQQLSYDSFDDIPEETKKIIEIGIFAGAMFNSNHWQDIKIEYK